MSSKNFWIWRAKPTLPSPLFPSIVTKKVWSKEWNNSWKNWLVALSISRLEYNGTLIIAVVIWLYVIFSYEIEWLETVSLKLELHKNYKERINHELRTGFRTSTLTKLKPWNWLFKKSQFFFFRALTFWPIWNLRGISLEGRKGQKEDCVDMVEFDELFGVVTFSSWVLFLVLHSSLPSRSILRLGLCWVFDNILNLKIPKAVIRWINCNKKWKK